MTGATFSRLRRHFENVTPTETAVAGSITQVFAARTGFPTVVTESSFMNQTVVIARLLADAYAGERKVADKMRPSIFREYAGCVIAGGITAYER